MLPASFSTLSEHAFAFSYRDVNACFEVYNAKSTRGVDVFVGNYVFLLVGWKIFLGFNLQVVYDPELAAICSHTVYLQLCGIDVTVDSF